MDSVTGARPRVRRWAAVAIAAFLGACDMSERRPGEQEAPEPVTPRQDTIVPPGERAAGAAARTGPATAAPDANVVQVTLTDFAIGLPPTLPAGPTELHVFNAGDVPHSIELEGADVEVGLPRELAPGQSAVLSIDLTAGNWEAYCPVGDHEERGMHLEVTVR